MGDGSDGSDGSGGPGDGGAGPGDGGGGYDPASFSSASSYNYDGSGGLAALYDENDPNNPFRNKKFQGFGFDQNAPGNWQLSGSMLKAGGGVDTTGSQVFTPVDQRLLDSIGYKGSNNSLSGIGSGQDFQGVAPSGYDKFLQDNHIQMFNRDLGNDNHVTQAFKDGNPVGQQYNWNYDRDFGGDNEFGMVLKGLAAAGGAAAGGGLAAGYGFGGGTAVGGAAAGAGGGLAGGAAATADFGGALKGAAIGGISGGALGAVNPANMAGITDPMYSKAVNGAVGSGLNSAMGGGNVGGSVLKSLVGSGISAGGNSALGAMMGDDYNQDYGHEGGNLLGSNGYAPESSGGFSPDPSQQQSTFARLSGEQPNYSTNPGMTGGSPTSGNLGSYFQPASAQQQPQQRTGNPVIDMGKRLVQSAGGGFTPGKMDNMGANLMDLYSRYKGYQNQKGLADNLSSMYGPNSPYAQQMEKALQRQAGAKGTRTQIGQRQVELQARLADANSRNAPTLAGIYGGMDKARMGMGSDILRMGMGGPNGGGGVGMLRDAGNGLQRMFGSQGGPQGYNPASDSNYVNGSDLQSDQAQPYADGGPVRGEPVVGTRSPVRSGGGGGLSPDAVRQAVIRSAAPASSPNTYVNPMNPRSVNDQREQQAGSYAFGGSVYGPGGPRSDSIPARLSNGEHVMDARSVNALGGGNNEQGQAVLNQLRARLHRS